MASQALPLFVFTHNDEALIESYLASVDAALARAQWNEVPVVSHDGTTTKTTFVPEIHVLANGCRDATVTLAEAYALHRKSKVPMRVHSLALGDKGEAWNYGVHTILADRTDVSTLLFLDSDIDLSQSRLDGLVTALCDNPNILASVSEPLKKKQNFNLRSPAAFVLSRSSQGHSDGKICGQLYSLRRNIAERIWLPRGLLVEDGFLAGCINTQMFSHEPDVSLIHANRQVHHFFDAEATLASAIKHEARLELGTHINAVVWPLLWSEGSESDKFLKARYDADPSWLVRLFADEVKRYGVRQFEWRRALEPFVNLRVDATLPLKSPIAALRAAQRSVALLQAYRDAKSGRLRW